MPIRQPAPILAATALALVLSGCGGDSGEAEVAAGLAPALTGAIEQRQDNFEGLGDAFKVIRDQLEADAPDMALITASAETIVANAGKITTSDWFPEGSGVDSGADTEALATIWEQPAEFEAAATRLAGASEAMLAAASSGDPAAVGAQVMELGGACKNCHDTFRLDKD